MLIEAYVIVFDFSQPLHFYSPGEYHFFAKSCRTAATAAVSRAGKSKITSVYRVVDAPVASFFCVAETIRNLDCAKNQILSPPEFLFFQRITIIKFFR